MNPTGNAAVGERIRRSKYGLGDRRTFEQLVEFSGVDPTHQRTLRDRCGNIDYVPFHEHPLGPDHIPAFDPVTFDPLDEPDEGSIYYRPPLSPLDERTVPTEAVKGEEKREEESAPVNEIITSPSPTPPSPRLRTSEDKEKLFEKRNYLINEMRQREEERRAADPEPLSSSAKMALRAEQMKEKFVVAVGRRSGVTTAGVGGEKEGEGLWVNICLELMLFLVIMLSCYYCTCTMIPPAGRATKKL
jgi:hypothetical protein